MRKVELEDSHEDIISKAMRGLCIGKSEMAKRLNIDRSVVDAILTGEVRGPIINAMAGELGLHGSRLLMSARKEWFPALVEITGLAKITSTFGSMHVNAYIIWSESTRSALVFDTGTDAESILQFIEDRELIVGSIFLTHTHPDHVACLEELCIKTKSPSVFVHELESMTGLTPICEGFEYGSTSMSINTLHTHGHSVGGLTYCVQGLTSPIAIVGDAIFAGSMGGGMVSYQDALQTNREKIMTLPDETILCPGHGPMTTVGEEKMYNPFFPEF